MMASTNRTSNNLGATSQNASTERLQQTVNKDFGSGLKLPNASVTTQSFVLASNGNKTNMEQAKITDAFSDYNVGGGSQHNAMNHSNLLLKEQLTPLQRFQQQSIHAKEMTVVLEQPTLGVAITKKRYRTKPRKRQ